MTSLLGNMKICNFLSLNFAKVQKKSLSICLRACQLENQTVRQLKSPISLKLNKNVGLWECLIMAKK